jgi:hypothetical protein
MLLLRTSRPRRRVEQLEVELAVDQADDLGEQRGAREQVADDQTVLREANASSNDASRRRGVPKADITFSYARI